jgi:hypothetical protein
MGLLPVLRVAVGISALLSVIALLYLVLKSRALGQRPLYAVPAGSATRGIWYAFTTGMLPSHKESAGRHLPTFLTGIIYHLGILGGFALLVMGVLVDQPSGAVMLSARLLLLAGLLAGLGLLGKRLVVRYMRKISVADDLLSNLLVNLFLAGGIAVTFRESALAVWYGATIVLLLYIPLGKIRHCVFFFYARGKIGAFFGRRGVFGVPAGQGLTHE